MIVGMKPVALTSATPVFVNLVLMALTQYPTSPMMVSLRMTMKSKMASNLQKH
jgi:hypothetical protein